MSSSILEGLGPISRISKQESMGIVSRGQKRTKNGLYFMFGGLKNLRCFHEVRRKVSHDGIHC